MFTGGLGVCIPDSCTDDDVKILVQYRKCYRLRMSSIIIKCHVSLCSWHNFAIGQPSPKTLLSSICHHLVQTLPNSARYLFYFSGNLQAKRLNKVLSCSHFTRHDKVIYIAVYAADAASDVISFSMNCVHDPVLSDNPEAIASM